MDRLVVYLSHPIGDDGINGPMRDNIANAGEWIRFFVDHTRYVILCPWYVYLSTHSGTIYAPRRLVDSIAAIERCDVLLHCGGILNPHMVYEAKAARRVGTPVVDLTSYGVLPPVAEDTTLLLINRIEGAIRRAPRRVWMPLLTANDVEQLIKARHQLYISYPLEHEPAVALLDRILQAAHEKIGEDEEDG